MKFKNTNTLSLNMCLMLTLFVSGVLRGENRPPAHDEMRFLIGWEYASTPTAAREMASSGARFSKIPLVSWDRLEPIPPKDGVSTYRWEHLDSLVTSFQAVGFSTLVVVVKCRSRWGTEPTSGGVFASSAPRPEHWSTYRRFIRSLVERYDGDGVDDMPGLAYPVRYFEIESEAQHRGYWQSSTEQYLRTLGASFHEAKAANRRTKILLTGINLGDLFDDLPSAREIARRLDLVRRNPRTRPMLEFIETILRHPEFFDEIEFHYNYLPIGALGTVVWLRNQMRLSGYQKPIWAGDAAAAPFFAYQFNPRFTSSQSARITGALANNQDPNHDEVSQWYFREQARCVLQKIALSMATGLAGILVGNENDWPAEGVGNSSSWTHQGLVDSRGNRRPAYWVLKDSISLFRRAVSAQLTIPSKDARLIRIERHGTEPLWVVWSDGRTFWYHVPGNGRWVNALVLDPVTGMPRAARLPNPVFVDKSPMIVLP